jgi:shikimate dehydrogenase
MYNIDGKTKIYGLIANPIEHTKSPFIHNMLGSSLGINMVYVPFLVSHGRLEAALNGFKAANIKGFNITIPYKVEIMDYLDHVDERAKKIGAVNTVKIIDDRLIGYNTDADGLYRSCIQHGIAFKGKTVGIIGAGGAAKAVAIMCADEGVKKIIIVNRTISKANSIKSVIDEFYDLEVETLTMDQISSVGPLDICFQTTPIGTYPNVNECVIKEPDFFDKIEYAIDLIYNPSETLFLKEAKKKNTCVINGSDMLYYQAVKAFELWNDIEISDEIIKQCLIKFNEHIYKRN